MAKIKLLIVDDEAELVYPMSERLEIRGFEVEAVTNWSDALKLFDDSRFDLAIVDVKLPGLSGVELMKMIFQLQPDIKVILMSGHGSEEEARDCKAKGACELLIKPVKMNSLVNKILKIIDSGDESEA